MKSERAEQLVRELLGGFVPASIAPYRYLRRPQLEQYREVIDWTCTAARRAHESALSRSPK